MEAIDKFIQNNLKYAKAVNKAYKIPVLVSLAQSALETTYGKNTPGNNYFGIKAGSSWTGQTQVLLTTEIVTEEEFKKIRNVYSSTRLQSGKYQIKIYQKFRKYNKAADSWDDYGRLLINSERYRNAFNYTNNPAEFANQVTKAGYSTDDDYFKKVYNIMILLKKKLPVKRQKALQVAA